MCWGCFWCALLHAVEHAVEEEADEASRMHASESASSSETEKVSHAMVPRMNIMWYKSMFDVIWRNRWCDAMLSLLQRDELSGGGRGGKIDEGENPASWLSVENFYTFCC